MRVLHLSATPLVGAPGAICKALNMHPGVQARWAVLDPTVGAYEHMTFDLDLTWATHRDEIIELAQHCDVLHLHNVIGLDNTSFLPINLRALWNRGVPMLRHFHSTPQWVSQVLGVATEEVERCPIPKLVVAQHPERFLPSARLVPNIVHRPTGLARTRSPDAPVRIGYAPSRFVSGRAYRWDTKGYPETQAMLRQLQREARGRGLAIEVDVIEQVPHAECLARKVECDLFIDDLVTGSYHLNTLEALTVGVPCLSHLDRRTQQALVDLTGRADFPVINAGLEDAKAVLLDLCSNHEARVELGTHAAAWMSQHWHPARSALHFLDAYAAVQTSPRTPFPARFTQAPGEQWQTTQLHDLLWANRTQRWPKVPTDGYLRVRGAAANWVRSLLKRR